ncbi:hypothetical protein LCGC14_2106300 [marine sediment metagenome]|uniref:Uncharacterized protein n=1 Tax=marine sediment metagenome TaxID=412755 RepID=A0A0F9EVS2_9ZZZZ
MADTKISALASAALSDSDEGVVNDGGTSKKFTVAELRTALGGVGFIPLDITSLREIASNDTQNLAAHGGILAQDSVPILERTSDATDKSLRVHWVSNGVEEVQFPPVPMPPDLDETADLTVHLVAEMSGVADTPTIDIQVWDGVGDTEMGGASSALADAIGEVTVTIANANVSGNPTGFLNIGLVPGAHGTDAIYLYAAWIEYTKKLPV